MLDLLVMFDRLIHECTVSEAVYHKYRGYEDQKD